MGEYMKYRGEDIKLGTCENLYYVTYDELRAMVKSLRAEQLSGNLAPHEYLDEKNGLRYRFPFPNDDREDYDKGVTVTIPPALAASEHNDIWVSLRSHSYNINAIVKCPMSPDADPSQYSCGPHPLVADIVQQRIIEGHLWTVLRCPHCGTKWRLPSEHGAQLVAHIRKEYAAEKMHSAEYWAQIADSIEQGYTSDVTVEILG